MLYPIEKRGVFFGYADERQIMKHGLKVYVFPVSKEVAPSEVEVAPDIVEKPRGVIRKVP